MTIVQIIVVLCVYINVEICYVVVVVNKVEYLVLHNVINVNNWWLWTFFIYAASDPSSFAVLCSQTHINK